MRALVALVLMLGLSTPGWAARNTSSDQPVGIKVELGQMTALTLTEPVASVAAGFDKDQATLDYDGNYVFFALNDPGLAGRFFVLDVRGKLHTINFKLGTPSDDVVHLVAPSAPQVAKAQPFSVASFLRALRSDVPVPGEESSDLPAPVANDPRVVIVQGRTVALGNLVGMTLAVRNAGPTPLVLDERVGESFDPSQEGTALLAQWAWPPRMDIEAVTAQEPLLAPGTETRLVIIFSRRP